MTERALGALAVTVLGLQLAAAALPVWTPAGPASAPDPAAATFSPVAEGVSLLRSEGPGLRARLSCAAGSRCRVDAVWPAGWQPGAALAEAEGTVSAGGVRLVWVSGGRRDPAAWTPGADRARTATPGDPPPDQVMLAMIGDGASVDLRRLSVAPARRSPLRVTVLTTWWVAVGALALHGGRALASAVDRSMATAMAAFAPVVVAGMVMPSAWLQRLLLAIPGTRAEDLRKDLFSEPTVAVVAQKVGGHGIAFALLAAFALRAGAGLPRAAWWMTLLAVLTESVQALLPDRSARLSDVVVDLAGAATGAWAWWVTRRR